jgi:hypothetical protein
MSDIEVNLGSFASEIQARLEAGEKEIGDLKQYIVGLRGSLNREDYKGINEERAARVIAERRLLDARAKIEELEHRTLFPATPESLGAERLDREKAERERDEAEGALRLLASEVDAGRRDCQCGDLNCQHVAITDGLLAAILGCYDAARAAEEEER